MFKKKRILIEPKNKKERDWLKRKDEFALTWRNLSIYVKVPRKKIGLPYKRLIDNVTGIVKPGTLVVLMGPSGSGKSTLMEALAFRSSGEVLVEGDIRVNGHKVDEKFRQISGFLHQEDLFVETLTVREHLEFMARLKVTSRDVKFGPLVNKVLTEMSLLNCADSRIGRSGENSCISGGERKRLGFAVEILNDPPILFCDEPTTGLDSFSAISIVTLMKEMSLKGKTVLCTVHQPSSDLFAVFQEIILLTEGRIAFIGTKKEAINFFKDQGYPCPDNYNPAEIMMNALSSRPVDHTGTGALKICDQFSASSKASKIDEEISGVDGTDIKDFVQSDSGAIFSMSAAKKFYWLLKRSCLQISRDPSVQIIRIVQKLGIALMASLCFRGNVLLTQKGIQATQGAIFILITENTFPSMYGVLSIYADEYPLLVRERKNHLYSIKAYYAAKLISLLPGLIVEPVLFLLISYFVSGLKTTTYAFLMTCLFVVLATNVASACGTFFVNAFGSVSIVMALLVPIDYILMVTSGLFIKISSLPFYIRWFRYLSWFLHANEALSVLQWENVANITCEYENSDVPCLNRGKDVLDKFNFSPNNLHKNLMSLGLLYVIFHTLSILLLSLRIKRHL